MVNMKATPEEKKEMTSPVPMDAPEYPYGLRISLNEDSMNKLKMKDLPKVGDTMTITAKVKVCGASQYESEGGGHRSCELQITDMEIGGKKIDAEKKIYPEGEA